MTDGKQEPLRCPCCGGTATVSPHLIEAGFVNKDGQTWPDWWTASVNCDSCPLQTIGGGDTEEEAVEEATRLWNARAAVTDQQFAKAVHDGSLWGKCSECKERQGYYLDAETIQRQQERIADLAAENNRLNGQAGLMRLVMRDMFKGLRCPETYSGGCPGCKYHSNECECALEERLREFGIEV